MGEDQTSRQATGWSLPALLYRSSFSSFSSPLPTQPPPFLRPSPPPAPTLPGPRKYVSLLPPFLSVPLAPLYYSYFHAHVPPTVCACGSTIRALSLLVPPLPWPRSGLGHAISARVRGAAATLSGKLGCPVPARFNYSCKYEIRLGPRQSYPLLQGGRGLPRCRPWQFAIDAAVQSDSRAP